MSIREQIIFIGRKLYERGFVAANDGNISAMEDDGSIWITPSGGSKGEIKSDQLIRMDLDGNILEGSHKKSSETEMHLRVYRENREVRAAIHTHAAHATSFAIAGIPLDVPCYPEALVLLGKVPLAPYAKPGTPAVADSIAPFVKNYRGVLLENHGPLTWGKDLTEAFYRMESLENYAKILMFTKYILRSDKVLSKDQIDDLLDNN